MKKRLLTGLLIFCLAALAGCGQRIRSSEYVSCYAEDSNGQEYFDAKVLEISENSVLVEPLEGEDVLRSGDRLWVSTNVVTASGAPTLTVGDEIRVVYDGMIAETYPGQVNNVFAIYLLDEDGGVVSDAGNDG